MAAPLVGLHVPHILQLAHFVKIVKTDSVATNNNERGSCILVLAVDCEVSLYSLHFILYIQNQFEIEVSEWLKILSTVIFCQSVGIKYIPVRSNMSDKGISFPLFYLSMSECGSTI